MWSNTADAPPSVASILPATPRSLAGIGGDRVLTTDRVRTRGKLLPITSTCTTYHLRSLPNPSD